MTPSNRSYTEAKKAYGARYYLAHKKAKHVSPKVCMQCGRSFVPRTSKHLYCTRKCRNGKLRDDGCTWDKNGICKVCGKPFTRKRSNHLCCSRECVEKVGRRKPPPRLCERCGKEFVPALDSRLVNGERKKTRFCSKRCVHRALWNTVDESKEWRGVEWDRIAEAARRRDMHRCRICGTEKSDKMGRSMPVDHIIPERVMAMFSLSPHRMWNLITLCASCHSRKTYLEKLLISGDAKGYVRKLQELRYPMGPARMAMALLAAFMAIKEYQDLELHERS